MFKFPEDAKNQPIPYYRRSGRQIYEYTTTVSSLFAGAPLHGSPSTESLPEEGEVAVLFFWDPNECPWLAVRVTASEQAVDKAENDGDHATQGKRQNVFSRGLPQLQNGLAELGFGSERVASLNTSLDEQAVVFGKCDIVSHVTVRVEVDTDHRRFIRDTHQGNIEFQVFGRLYQGSEDTSSPREWRMQEDDKRVCLVIQDTADLEAAEFAMAFDCGNTSTTLAYATRPRKSDSSNDGWIRIETLKARKKIKNPDAIPSVISIHSVGQEHKTRLQEVPFDFGFDSLKAQATSQIHGLKRIAADPREEPIGVHVGPRDSPDLTPTQVRKGLPAELFSSGIFKLFMTHKKQSPLPIMVTYPSTFSRPEIDQLVTTYFDGLNRAHLTRLPDDKSKRKVIRQFIPRMIDEASAAAFYFVYKDFIEGPGKAAAFFYRYPKGVNILIYDCGGGTTDIALVHVLPKAIKDGDGKQTGRWDIQLNVQCRTGKRDFAGDAITAEFFKVAKAVIANKIQPLTKDDAVAKLTPALLHENLELIDDLVPTRTDRHDENGEHLDPFARERRRKLTYELWGFAEELKIWATTPKAEADNDEDDVSQDMNSAFSRRVTHLIKGISEIEITSVSGLFTTEEEAFCGGRDELVELVDKLLETTLGSTLKMVNQLIVSRLTPDLRDPETDTGIIPPRFRLPSTHPRGVDWVYVLGQGSRYPAVTSAVRDGVRAPWLKVNPVEPDKATGEVMIRKPLARFKHDGEWLKSAVAKGAAIAEYMTRTNEQITISWDESLADKMPFHLVTLNQGTDRGERIVFHEDTLYSEMDYTRKRPLRMDQTSGLINVYRLWHGGERELYLTFDVTGASGPFNIWYEQSEGRVGRFVVEDESNPERRPYVGIYAENDAYIPFQDRGTL